MPQRVLDVSELEAPEPLVQAIAALKSLQQGEFLRFCHRMKPCHLYRFLEENGFESDTRRGAAVECEVFIWHKGDADAAGEAARVAAVLEPWVES